MPGHTNYTDLPSSQSALSFPEKPRVSNQSKLLSSRATSRKLITSIFPPAYSSEPALSASDFFSGKSAQPKLIDLETKAISTSSATIAAAPAAAAAAKASPTESAPTKSQSAPANYHTPTAPKKVEPVSAFKEEFSPESSPDIAPKKESEAVEAKSLEIEQPESEDEELTPAAAPVAAAPAAAKEEPKIKEFPAPAKSEITAVSYPNHTLVILAYR